MRHTERTCQYSSFDLGDAAKSGDAYSFNTLCQALAPVGFRLVDTSWDHEAMRARYMPTAQGKRRLARILRVRAMAS